MQIYVDADACPKVIKELLYKAVKRVKVKMTLVADQYLRIPQSDYISSIQVPSDIDSADEKIVELIHPGDLVITADIPLADQVVSKGCYAINPRGELYSERNIKEHLAVRDMMTEMRSSGLEFGGPPPFNPKDKEKFANQLDRFLTKNIKSTTSEIKKSSC
jgi:uncharacterized protein YaiI (UPF0178 family)